MLGYILTIPIRVLLTICLFIYSNLVAIPVMMLELIRELSDYYYNIWRYDDK